jgi:glycogen(starch) synthase
MLPRPVLATLHCDYRDLFRSHPNDALLAMFRQAAVVVALSQPMQRDLLTRFPALADRLELLPSGLPWPATEPKPLPFAPPLILCLGRLVHDKGFDLALHALALLSARHPDLRLIIAGDGLEREQLERTTRELSLDQRVLFQGRVEPTAVPDLLNRATIVVVPSRNEEPSSVVLREAAQMGRAIVASNVGGTYELIEHGVNGLLVEKENPAAMAMALDRLLSQPEEAQALGTAARLRARNQFDFQRYFDHLLDLYRLAQSRFAANLPSPF